MRKEFAFFLLEDWNDTEITTDKKLRMCNRLAKIYGKELGVKKRVNVIFSPKIQGANKGLFDQKQKVILVNYSLAVDGICEIKGMGIEAKHPGLQVMMTIFHEMVHAKQRMDIKTWEKKDISHYGKSRERILFLNLSDHDYKLHQGKGYPYISSQLKSGDYSELYYLQPCEYEAFTISEQKCREIIGEIVDANRRDELLSYVDSHSVQSKVEQLERVLGVPNIPEQLGEAYLYLFGEYADNIIPLKHQAPPSLLAALEKASIKSYEMKHNINPRMTYSKTAVLTEYTRKRQRIDAWMTEEYSNRKYYVNKLKRETMISMLQGYFMCKYPDINFVEVDYSCRDCNYNISSFWQTREEKYNALKEFLMRYYHNEENARRTADKYTDVFLLPELELCLKAFLDETEMPGIKIGRMNIKELFQELRPSGLASFFNIAQMIELYAITGYGSGYGAEWAFGI